MNIFMCVCLYVCMVYYYRLAAGVSARAVRRWCVSVGVGVGVGGVGGVGVG